MKKKKDKNNLPNLFYSDILYIKLIEETIILQKELIRLNNKINSKIFEKKVTEQQINNTQMFHKTNVGRKSKINFFNDTNYKIDNNGNVLVTFD